MENVAWVAEQAPEPTPAPPPASNILSGWTVERVDLLERLWAKGLSFTRIAEEVGGVTRNACIGKAHRRGLSDKDRVRSQQKLTDPERARRLEERGERRREQARIRYHSLPPELRPSGSNRKSAQASAAVAVALPPPDFLGLTFIELERGMCRYPLGEGAQMRFCGQPARDGHSWCEHCCTIVYRPLNEVRQQFIPFRRKAA